MSPQKKLVLFLIVFFMLGVVTLLLVVKGRPGPRGFSPLAGVESSQVKKIRIDQASSSIVLEKSGPDWRIISPIEDAADSNAIDLLVESLKDISVGTLISEKSDRYGQFGLDPAHTIRVRVFTSSLEKPELDAFIDRYELADPALATLAAIVRGADTSDRGLTPESAGLYAAATGFQAISRDDFDNMARQFPMYDALYEFARAQAATLPPRPRVLFVCLHGAAKSVIGAAHFRRLAAARGLVFPAEDDFGIVCVEALASGAPVVALAAGGVFDIVRDGQEGVLVDVPEARAFAEGVLRAERARFEPRALRDSARRFDVSRFRERVRAVVDDAHEKGRAK